MRLLRKVVSAETVLAGYASIRAGMTYKIKKFWGRAKRINTFFRAFGPAQRIRTAVRRRPGESGCVTSLWKNGILPIALFSEESNK